MRFQGKLCKDGRWWLAEVPVFDALTQGHSRKEAFDMIADWFQTMVDRKDFPVTVHPVGKDDFEVSSTDARAMISLLLQRQRQKSGLSIAEAASSERDAGVTPPRLTGDVSRPWRLLLCCGSRVSRVSQRRVVGLSQSQGITVDTDKSRLEAPVDMLLCDGFPPGMLPVLKLVAPRLRPGAVVVADNVGAFWADHSDYLGWVRDPSNGFQSAMLAMNEGTELSVRLA